MHSATEDVQDREKIRCEFFLRTVNCLAENHEFATVLFNEVLSNTDTESGESVPMGNNNLDLIILQKPVQ